MSEIPNPPKLAKEHKQLMEKCLNGALKAESPQEIMAWLQALGMAHNGPMGGDGEAGGGDGEEPRSLARPVSDQAFESSLAWRFRAWPGRRLPGGGGRMA